MKGYHYFALSDWRAASELDNCLRACFENRFWVAQATRLCRPATRRTEREKPFEPMGMAF